MVILCNDTYTTEPNSVYDIAFSKYEFPLSDFQKFAIQAIIDGNHTLVTAHTGSGKTLPAEFAIKHFTSLNKKVVYTSPIKALSNQKYYDFTQKFPDISVGLFTGDIKTNPGAQVLIMTTEILMNYLFSMNDNNNDTTIVSDFQLNIQEELGCVIFDEVHYINDAHRGQNWEKTILMLPSHIQMVMLSATIDSPEKFAEWCERDGSGKKVVLSSTKTRVVPLTHYGFLCTNEGVFKRIKDKETQQKIKRETNSLITLKTPDNYFQENGFLQIKRNLKLFENNNVFINKTHVLNELVKHLFDNELLPAIAFVFSRKMVETYAKAITTNILEFDSKIAYTMRDQCDQVIRKLPNYKEYIQLPEYDELVKLLEKGIGYHHSGMIPIFREIVETMISRGNVKLLFATESFAIGLDCPIRTAVFTSLTKFDGEKMRYLLSHEYNQAAGRAGRRGLDAVGHVIHCNNMFNFPSESEYYNILCGMPQSLTSKFYISFDTILSLLKNGKSNQSDFIDFVEKSMLKNEITNAIDKESLHNSDLKDTLQKKEEYLKNLRTPIESCHRYLELTKPKKHDTIFTSKLNNKQKKAQEREISDIKDNNHFLLQDLKHVEEYDDILIDYNRSSSHITNLSTYIEDNISKMCTLLQSKEFITSSDSGYLLTPTGVCASHIAEIHGLIMSECLKETNWFEDFDVSQIIGLLSTFSDIKVSDDLKSSVPNTKNIELKNLIKSVKEKYENYANLESEYNVNSGFDYDNALSYDLIDPLQEWSTLESEQQCKYFIQSVLIPLEVGLGDFTKGILKISAISKELGKVSELQSQAGLQYKLSQVDQHILKFVATSQSLYTG
jgi:antiviral helicase SKI2